MNSNYRKPFRLIAVAGALALISGSFMTACSTSGSDRSDTHPNKGVERVSEKTYKFKGTVMYHRDGDYYSILSDRGMEYYPLNLKHPYRKSGLRVQIYGETRGYAMNGKMRALDIFEISRPSESN
jgi:hypothetical protein